MKLNEKLYQRYLEELQTLENFKSFHSSRYSNIMKDVMEDPATKHLMEVLAFFTARNHLHGENIILNLYRRLFRQYFPFLWSPLPSMGIIQLSPSKDLVETIECREGTEISLQTQEEKRAYFRTMEEVKVLPIHPTRFHFEFGKEKESLFKVQFSAPLSIDEEVGKFRLYINHLNYFPSSLSLAMALRHHLKKIVVIYDQSEFEDNKGQNCSFDFGTPQKGKLFNHPIETLRSKLHLPEQENFININVPLHTKRWHTFTLCFHLGTKWPKSLPLSKDSFIPFAVPIINLQKKQAELIRCDGTKDDYPILYPSTVEGYALHSVLGVYSIENHKTTPLKPGILANDKGAYEIDAIFDETHSIQYRLQLNIPEAFKSSKLITIEALWYQPWFDEIEYTVKPTIQNQILKQIHPRIIGKLCSPEDQAGLFDIPFLTRLLALKNQTRLDLNDIIFLMNTLKTHKRSYFNDLAHLATDLAVNQQNSSFSFATAHEYRFLLEKLDDKNRDLSLTYFRYIKQFLDLWLPNVEVAVTLNAPNFDVPITIKEGTSHETSSLVRNLFLL